MALQLWTENKCQQSEMKIIKIWSQALHQTSKKGKERNNNLNDTVNPIGSQRYEKISELLQKRVAENTVLPPTLDVMC